ncbi:AraC family transcriptional regulator [Pseudomonas fluorescens]|uniref:AraC family transcriptional regulator n=1 Tax=Pseudomonas fluorescens TaxID=294 RepID=A0A327MQ69_PSEFL|nr:helix-turn-helix domain-containing protein [Pseudomonas fluorescens]RAI64865.1 AraC family transcriptional regulator [Pseudomonas fluorescens]
MNNKPCVDHDALSSCGPPQLETACQVRSHSTTDIDVQASSISGWDQIYDQLSPGCYSGSITECWLDDVQVIRERSNQCVHQMGFPWRGARTFIIPMAQQGVARFGSQVIEASMPATLGPGQELDFRTPPTLDVMSIALSAEAVTELSITTEGFDLETSLRGSRCPYGQVSGLSELRTLLDSVSHVLQHTPELLAYPAVRKGLRHALLTSFFSIFSNIGNQTERNQRILLHKRVVDKAREYVLANTEQPVTIAELCSIIGVSRRTLQMCFQEIMGTNPVQYLRAIRLNQVRRQLRQNDGVKVKVQDVACNWGFWHLSSFTADYKRMFGELPSQTLYKTGQ